MPEPLTKEQIEAGNELIRKFLGIKNRKPIPANKFPLPGHQIIQPPPRIIKRLDYHNDWNNLMRACEVFDNVYLKHKWDDPVYAQYRELCDEIDDAITCYDKLYAFRKLVKAIEWYYRPFCHLRHIEQIKLYLGLG